MFSNSSGMLKPPAIEKPLECSLEELCFGCSRKMKVTRAVVKINGYVTICMHAQNHLHMLQWCLKLNTYDHTHFFSKFMFL